MNCETKIHKDEDKNIVTPLAFSISEHLLNKPLASPVRRLIALSIDLLCVAILSSLNPLLLATFIALIFFRANAGLARQGRLKRMRMAMVATATFLLFAIVYSLLSTITGVQNDHQDSDFTGKQALLSASMYLALGECKELECKRQIATDFGESFAQTNITADKFETLIKKQIRADESIPEFEQEMLVIEATNVFTRTRYAQLNQPATPTEPRIETDPADDFEVQDPYSVIEWFKGFVGELGLGFGWAALYFSTLPTYFRGATIGKNLIGIYVVRLDGSTPSLWENFGRYGGYGAGLATGLMGFLQIFWDPNRQAIQDKISETLVLRKIRNTHKVT